jgi:hypothetical protein
LESIFGMFQRGHTTELEALFQEVMRAHAPAPFGFSFTSRRRQQRQGGGARDTGGGAQGLPAGVLEQLPCSVHSKKKRESCADGADGEDGGEEDQCGICLAEFDEGDRKRLLPCLHTYHKSCIDRWLSVSSKCPMCNQVISIPDS